ncbi:hypothetical protein RV00_GL002250 [Enterococcus devriesei]|uniref:Uncharacterized protein n=1 Tax=Enterococcus devriesei TaxID=319970 RepID=A0A1L8SVY0_9ENTE|nr:hypothetical protein RV00_GL002250 [Enterococcus devriesei]
MDEQYNRFGSIQNNIALKRSGRVRHVVKCFGSIQNNIALKHKTI